MYDAIALISNCWDDLDNNVIIKSWKPLLEQYEPYRDLYDSITQPKSTSASDISSIQLLLGKLNIEISTERLEQWLESVDGPKREILTDYEIINLITGQPEEESKDVNSEVSDVDQCTETSTLEESDQPEVYEDNRQEEYHEVNKAFYTLIEYFKKENQNNKVIALKDWQQSFLDKALDV